MHIHIVVSFIFFNFFDIYNCLDNNKLRVKANPQPVSACWHNYCSILITAVLGNIFIIYQEFYD